MKSYSLLIMSLLATSEIYANSASKREVVQELVQKLEATDPNIKSHRDQWAKVREHLEQASQQSESNAGLKLSVQHILDQWIGLRFRVLDTADAQYWALNGQSLNLPRAWFQQKGARWVVQYSDNESLRRGDSFLMKDFQPFAKEFQAKSEWTLPSDKPLKVKLTSKPLSEWALDLSQKSSKTILHDNKKICVEKVWFWLDKSVGQILNSKFQSGLCQAFVLDLRDTFGEGVEKWTLPSSKIPTAVLVNRGTREGAASLAKSLKDETKAYLIGEVSESNRPLQKKDELSKIDWALVVIGDGGEVEPNKNLKDSFLNAEGVDDIQEAAFDWIKKQF